MKKTILAIIIILALSFITSGAWAAPGDSFDDPIFVSTPAELDNVRNGLNSFYRLRNDIDLTAYLAPGGAGDAKWGESGWLPIGTNTVKFTGGFDGGGNRITGLWIQRLTTPYVGLFGYISDSTIINLGVEISDMGVRGYNYTGGLTGVQEGTSRGDSIIENCYVTGHNSSSIFSDAGGLVGIQSSSNGGSCSVINCYTAIYAGSRQSVVGGLVGRQSATAAGSVGGTSIIVNSYATGDTGSRFGNVGGLVGYQTAGYNSICSVENCYATGESYSNDPNGSNIGGLIGNQYTDSGGTCIVKNCYATGGSLAVGVNGANVGGLIGSQSGTYGSRSAENCYALGIATAERRVGGLVGNQDTRSSIKNSFTASGLCGHSQIYGIAGQRVDSDSITNCYRYSDNLFQVNDPNGIRGGIKTSADFKTKETYTENGWLFNDSTPEAGPWHWDDRGFPILNIGNENPTFYWDSLVITPTITIYIQPAAYTNVTEGAITGSLFIEASTNMVGTISYQWYSNMSNSNMGGTVIEGATSESFTIPAALTAAGSPYYYFCEVSATDVEPARSNVAIVAVNSGEPVITINTHPANANVTEGVITGNLSVTASVTGGATLTYQWYSNTSNSNTGGTVIGGATTASFAIPTTLTAAGSPYYYFCEVGAAGATSVRSNAATVTVNAPAPIITINAHPANTSVTEGAVTGNLSVTASVTGGASLTYQWYSNTSNSNTGGTAIGGATSASFTIPTTLMAAGSPYYYFCEVGAAGATSVRSNAATVTVNAPAPIITINAHPANTSVTEGAVTGNLSVSASVTGGASLTYQWYSNTSNSNTGGTAIGSATSASFTIPTTLTAAGSPYYYFCEVGAAGATSVRSNAATVMVNAPTPVITIHAHPANTSVTEGAVTGNLTVSASVTGGASLTYQWYSNTSNSNTGGTAIGGATNASFTIPIALTAAGSPYFYFCEVGAAGATSVRSNAATVTVNIAFIAVTNISGVASTATTGTPLALFGTVEPSNATNNTIAWSVANAGATGATISGNMLNTTADGTVTVKATIANGLTPTANYTQDFTITVSTVTTPVLVTGVILNKSYLGLLIGGSETLIATIQPADTTDRSLVWRCDNPYVATVNPAGLVTAIAAGSATISVRTTDGGFEASCYVYITTPAGSVTIDPLVVTIDVGDIYFLMATIEPFNVSNSVLTWSSSNEAAATVTQGGLVRAVGAGTTTITATAADGSGVSGTSTVNVVAPPTEATADMLTMQPELPVGTPAGIVTAEPIIFIPADPSDMSLETDMLEAMMPGIAAAYLSVNENGAITIEERIAKEIAKELLSEDQIEVVTIPVFEAVINNNGEIAAVSFRIKGNCLMMDGHIDIPENVRLLSILSADRGGWYTYADSADGLGDKTFTILDMSNNIFTGSFEPDSDYILVLLIKDGGEFDLDGRADGSVWGASALVGIR